MYVGGTLCLSSRVASSLTMEGGTWSTWLRVGCQHSIVVITKVETQIHDKYKGIGNLGVQRAWSESMNVLANPKGNVGRWNMNFWRLEQFYTNF